MFILSSIEEMKQHDRVIEVLETVEQTEKLLYSILFDYTDISLFSTDFSKEINDFNAAIRLSMSTLGYLKTKYNKQKEKDKNLLKLVREK